MFNSVSLPLTIPALNKDSDSKYLFECLLAPSALTVFVVSGGPPGAPPPTQNTPSGLVGLSGLTALRALRQGVPPCGIGPSARRLAL
ncbi:unknown [Beak and feather disease virus]|uniref:Uncharacterized protein ORF7 n=1 Tax=Beak and feather disease virus TaxID=77856 RepID=ORF7_BFDV|nr:RecName: Full=Uncharacterized protein ORF7 [Beak and feather disease virus]AAC69867.1 unknown [Beak and feather disease virus]